MDATPRFRLFDSRRAGIDQEEGAAAVAAQSLPRRRMVTSVSVARARRRNRRRPGTHRAPPFIMRLLSLAGAASRRRQTVFLLLLAVCAAGVLVSSGLTAWAASSRSPSSWTPLSPRKPPHHTPSTGTSSAEHPREDDHKRRRRSAVSLGPDAIPSVVLVERRHAGGGARRASSVDTGAEEVEGGDTEEARRGRGGGSHNEPPSNRRCLNTAQGAELLADSEGRVCRRSEADDAHRPGCCAARPPSLPGRDGGSDWGDDHNELAAPEESYAGPDAAATHAAAASASATDVRRGRALELVALTPTTTHGEGADTAAAAAADAAESQPGGGGIWESGFPPEQALSTPFSCWSCDEGGDGSAGDGGGFSSCCRSYEFCVSCCQAPWREEEREVIREAAARAGHPVYRELGLAKEGGGGDLSRKDALHQLLRGAALDDSPETEEEEEEEEEEREHQARKTREAAFAHCAFRCRTYSGSVAHENSYRGPLKHCFGRFRPPVEGAPGVIVAGAQHAMMPASGEGGLVRNGVGGQGAPPLLQLDPFLADLA
eukprot:g4953.t1